jgi:hypothetical protein
VTRLTAIALLAAGCTQTGATTLEGTVWRSTVTHAAVYFEKGYRERAEERRVVVCDWDNGPQAADFGTFYGTYSDETGLITYDDFPDEPLGVAARGANQIELFIAGEGAADTTPYEPVPSWDAATRDAFAGACGQTCGPDVRGKDLQIAHIYPGSPVQTKVECRDWCTAAAGGWIDCMHVPDTGSGGYCDCTPNPEGNAPF